MEFSIVVPTRGRPENMLRLLNSIIDTSYDIDNVEVIFRIDTNDEKSIEFMNLATQTGLLIKTKFYVNSRNEFLSDLWQEGYELAVGKRVMMCGDDIVFETQNWDKIIVDSTPDPEYNYYYVYGRDGYKNKHGATHPFFSQAWINNLGYFVPCGYKWGRCDVHLQDVAEKLIQLTGDAAFFQFRPDLMFRHVHPSCTKDMHWDETYNDRLSYIQESKKIYDLREEERWRDARRLAGVGD